MTTSTPQGDNRLAIAPEGPSRGRIALLTADGVEEVEFFYPYYRFTEAGYDVDVITPNGGPLRGYRGFGLEATRSLAEVTPDDYLMLFVPGGLAPLELRKHEAALAFLRAFEQRNQPIGFVCHGPQLMVSAGLAAGRRMTSWFEVADEINAAGGEWLNRAVVQDGQIFTARKPGDLPAEMARIISYLDTRDALTNV
jgi:protease I